VLCSFFANKETSEQGAGEDHERRADLKRSINTFGESRMIVLSKNTVSATAAANTTIGTLTLLDSTGAAYNANWSLTPSAANYFNAGGAVLQTLRASIPAGLYAIKVRANATGVALKQKARFVIQVS
jgi:hypothetical protein